MPLFIKEIIAGALVIAAVATILLTGAVMLHYLPNVFAFLLFVGLCWGIGALLVDDYD